MRPALALLLLLLATPVGAAEPVCDLPPRLRPMPSRPAVAPPAPAAAPTPIAGPKGAPSILRGRVFQRGSIAPLPGAQIESSTGQSAVCDADGRFELELPAGAVELTLRAERYEPLRVREDMPAGRRLEIEYRLLPVLTFKTRFTATVRGDPRRDGERYTLRDDELRTLPGTLGDPFRVIGLLPGVATPVPLLPAYVIRGASPGMNGYFLDGMRVPQLFHLLLLGSVTHAGLVDRVDFYPGAYDASFGRFAGGIIDAETRSARGDGYHGELQLRVFDVGALAELKLPGDVRVSISGHYGYPGPIVRAFDSRIDLQFWDYQFRLDWKGFTVQAIGSYDYVNITREEVRRGMLRRVPTEFRLMFHRVQLRHRHARGPLSTEVGLVGGADELSAFGGNGVRKLSLAARANAQLRFRRLRIFGGVEAELSRFTPENFGSEETQNAPDELADFGDGRNGIVGGAFLQATADLWPGRLTMTVGGRADFYHAGSVTLVGLEPRAQLRLKAQEWLTLLAAAGLYQQPPSFPVPLPGIDTFALQLGLQRAVHASSGMELKLPLDFTVKATGYYQKFFNINDVVVDLEGPQLCTSPPPESLRGTPALVTRQVDGQSYGMELMVRRQAERVSGWVSYTLGRAERIFSCGLRPADYDQTHILNVVLQVRLPWRLMAGARLSYASGRAVTIFEPPDGTSTVRNNSRLPDYVQLDLRIDREWRFRRWALAAFLEVVNTTFAQTVFGLVYPEEDVTLPDGRMATLPRYDKPQLNGFSWILPSIGVRAHF